MPTDKKIALVTGANRGIGYEACRQLADAGMQVILTSRDVNKGEAAAKVIRGEGKDVRFHQLDVADERSVAAGRILRPRWMGRTHSLCASGSSVVLEQVVRSVRTLDSISIRVRRRHGLRRLPIPGKTPPSWR